MSQEAGCASLAQRGGAGVPVRARHATLASVAVGAGARKPGERKGGVLTACESGFREPPRGVGPIRRARRSGITGIMAVSLSKMINRGDVFLSFSNEDRASAFLGDELERLARASQTSRRKLPPSIIDLRFHVMTPALHRRLTG